MASWRLSICKVPGAVIFTTSSTSTILVVVPISVFFFLAWQSSITEIYCDSSLCNDTVEWNIVCQALKQYITEKW